MLEAELHARLEQIEKHFDGRTSTQEAMYQAVQDTVNAWNKMSNNGHRRGCLYMLHASAWPCTCQPPTLWGETKLWYCSCCGRPGAWEKYGLCDVCSAHQYGPYVQVEQDHREKCY